MSGGGKASRAQWPWACDDFIYQLDFRQITVSYEKAEVIMLCLFVGQHRTSDIVGDSFTLYFE